MFTKSEKAYLAGFLDGDGSIYVRLKPNSTYRYGFQIAPHIVFFQSSKDQDNFEKICRIVKFGKLRKRKDEVINFLKEIKPFLILKREQAELALKIIKEKEKVKSKNDFKKLVLLIDRFEEINYSKKRKKHILTP